MRPSCGTRPASITAATLSGQMDSHRRLGRMGGAQAAAAVMGGVVPRPSRANVSRHAARRSAAPAISACPAKTSLKPWRIMAQARPRQKTGLGWPVGGTRRRQIFSGTAADVGEHDAVTDQIRQHESEVQWLSPKGWTTRNEGSTLRDRSEGRGHRRQCINGGNTSGAMLDSFAWDSVVEYATTFASWSCGRRNDGLIFRGWPALSGRVLPRSRAVSLGGSRRSGGTVLSHGQPRLKELLPDHAPDAHARYGAPASGIPGSCGTDLLGRPRRPSRDTARFQRHRCARGESMLAS